MPRWVIVLVGALAVVVGASNAFTPRAMETHEVFVAQTAREMLAAGEWVLPTFNGEPRLNKPPLAYWLVMGLERVLPSDVPVPEWKARFPSAIAAAVVAVCATLVAWRLYGRVGTALLSGLLVAGSSGVFRYGNNARPEMLYAATCALMLWGFVEAAAATDRSRRQALWAAFAWFSAGLAILAKGPHFPVLMLAGFAACAFIHGRGSTAYDASALTPRRLSSVLRPWWGIPLMLGVALPWVIAVIARAPAAGVTWFEQISDAPDRGERTWLELLTPYYVWGLPQMILPWAVLLPFAVASPFARSADARLRNGRVLFWVFTAVFVALSITTHRRSYYMLPMLVCLAPLAAAGTFDAVTKLRPSLAERARAAIFIAAFLTVGVLAVLGRARWVWGEGGEAKQRFAIAVRDAVQGGTVHLLGERPGLITYTLNRVTPSHDSIEELAAVVAAETWLVAHPRSLDSLRERFAVSEPVAAQSTGEASEDRVLVRVVPRTTGP